MLRGTLYETFLVLYILLTSFFVLAFKMPYSDRFGILSWVLIPIVILPIFNCSKSIKVLGLILFIAVNVLLYIML